MESELAVSCLYKGFHFNFDFGRGIHADSSWFEERDRAEKREIFILDNKV